LKDRRDIGHRVTGKHAFLCEMAGALAGEDILDLGCGIGWFEEYAELKGCARVKGVDTDEVRLDRAAIRAPGAVFVNDDAVAVMHDPDTFTVIAVFDFLEHLPRERVPLVLARAAASLPQGGRLLLSVPYRGLISTLLDPTFYFGHRHYRLVDLHALLERSGFGISRVRYGGDIWEHLSMLWLYFFKWVFAREMPFEAFLERKRHRAYVSSRLVPTTTSATMFVEAVRRTPIERALS
jgi:SAM-dependent methyltransferase